MIHAFTEVDDPEWNGGQCSTNSQQGNNKHSSIEHA